MSRMETPSKRHAREPRISGYNDGFHLSITLFTITIWVSLYNKLSSHNYAMVSNRRPIDVIC